MLTAVVMLTALVVVAIMIGVPPPFVRPVHHRLLNDHCLIGATPAVTLADRGSDGRAGACADYGAIRPAGLVANRRAGGSADRSTEDFIALLVEVGAATERSREDERGCNESEHGHSP